MSLLRRLRALMFQRKAEHEMEREIRFHMDRETEKNVAAGLSPAEARRKAAVDFGGVETVREEHRAARGLPLLEEIWADLRYALRSLRRSPAFAVSCVATLAVGIGINSSVFAVGDAILLRPLPYPHADRLVSAWSPGATNAAAEYVAVRDRVSAFQSVGAYDETGVNLGGAGSAVRARAGVVTPDLFETLGVAPALGRWLDSGASRPGAAPEAVLSDALWRARFGARPDVLDSSVLVDGTMRRVVGVMPSSFHFPSVGTDLWIPALIDPLGDVGTYWGWWHFQLVARLAPGATARQARDQMRAMAVGLRREHAVWDPGPGYGQHADAVPLQAQLGSGSRGTLLLLAAVAAVLFVIACANVVNLMLVRTGARDAELRTRVALGAGRTRLTRLLITETLVVGLGGGMAAVLGARGALLLLRSLMPASLLRIAPYSVDGRVIAFTVFVALAAGLAVGAVPALRLRSAMITQRAATGDRRRHRFAGLVTVLQVALAVGLVSVAGLLLRSLSSLTRVSPGFADSVLAGRVTLAWAKYTQPGSSVRFFEQAVDSVRALPAVITAGAVSDPPLRGPVYGSALRIEGQFEDLHHTLPTVQHRQIVTPDYFATMQIPLLRGRAFTADDRAGAPWVAVVSASMARRFWPGQDPIGRRIGQPYESPWITVVGIAGDVQQDSLSGTGEGTVYLPLSQSPFPVTDMTIVARVAGNPLATTTSLRAAVRALDPDAPVSDVRTTGQIVRDSLSGPRFVTVLLIACATLATLLGAVGLYGVLASLVAERTREIGIRMALGATPRSIAALVMGRGARLALAGVAGGIAIGLAGAGALRSMLFGVSAHDPVSFVAAALTLAGVAVLASWVPARRALRSDPVHALRSE